MISLYKQEMNMQGNDFAEICGMEKGVFWYIILSLSIGVPYRNIIAKQENPDFFNPFVTHGF
jgi:hypothetical protein